AENHPFLNGKMKNMEIAGETSGYDSRSNERSNERCSSGGRNSGSGSGEGQRESESGSGSGGPPQRKADLAYNHLQLVQRPGLCKATRAKISVVTNYFPLNAPGHVKFVTFRLDFEQEKSRGSGTEPVKKEKLSEYFKLCYREHRTKFPSRDSSLVYNGTDMIYCPHDHKINHPYLDFQINAGATFKGRPARKVFSRMYITPLGITELPTVRVEDEADRCALMQFIDAVLTQEHRFDLIGRAARFVQHGHSLFKIPRANDKTDVKPIGKGEEVWLGLHAAVKTDSDCLMLNADTSGSIFKSRDMSLIQFYAQVMKGYTQSLENFNMENQMIEPRGIFEMEKLLKGTKLMMRLPGGIEKVKKFDGFTKYAADNEFFNDDRGAQVSVAQYFLNKYDYRLKCPKFPCLKFYNKVTRNNSSVPMEFFYTLEEPARFKGKLTDQQLDVFVKAVCQNPKEKKGRIERFCVAGGDYLGESATMREWGVSIGRQMVQIDDCPVLPLPHIEMKASAPHIAVNQETGEWKITETSSSGEQPIPPIEMSSDRIVLAVIFINETTRQGDGERVNLLKNTLRSYGLNIDPNVGDFSAELVKAHNSRMDTPTNTGFLNKHISDVKAHCANLTEKSGIKHIPLHIWVFPRRNAPSYAAIKYYCDVVHGVASQCTVRKTFEKLDGNCVTNTSAQNLLLKILAKTGSVSFRLSPFQHKNIERIQNPEEPVLVLGVDVSHPGREERFDAIDKHDKATGRNAQQANKYRGQHEKLPTARPAAKTLFADIGYYDCPRSVVSVVGTIDIKGSRYGVSSRVQRIGQEETVNMVEPFRERIQEFYDNVGSLPKHIIMYRDGASDTQVKKIAYEELESLERALETFDLESKKDVTITYICAAKRHHTRFFRANLDQMSGDAPHLNCPPGTLVEQSIVSRNKWDFYLQSHYGNLGTALPTRYTVVRDDWNVSPSFVQTIVFAHCFGNVRCPRPLSIPVPLHYAHLAAKRSKVLFDHYKENPTNEYINSKEDLVREEIERVAVTPHANIKEMKAMHYA
ncbi:hypothetical protein PENTCL1PPCAC_18501, partial [Pristionchus entomophagus]